MLKLQILTRRPLIQMAALSTAILLSVNAPAFAGAGQAGHGHGDAKPAADDHGPSGGGHMMGSGGRMMGGAGHGPAGHHGMAFGEPGKASDVKRTIEIEMHDNYYKPEKITVKAGETVRFKVINKGEFLHEFGLGTAAMHKAHQKQMMTMWEHGMIEADRINPEKMKMDHGDGHMMKHDDPNSILLEPGKSGEIVWKFTKPMSIEFACNIPGHYESGMMGPLKIN
jgi:uncharacterized cupredoxin-like copper-binding protein